METAEQLTKFNLEHDKGPLTWTPTRRLERNCAIGWLEFFQTMHGWLDPDYIAEQIQYHSELINGTYPQLWINLHIWYP